MNIVGIPRLRGIILGLLIAIPFVSASASSGSGNFVARDAVTGQALSAYTPDQLETAYDITPLVGNGIDGTGQKIALIELDRYSLSDIQQFDEANQLPDPSIQQIYVGGAFSLPNDGEATMDIEWAHALAPNAALQVYYVNDRVSSSAGWKALASAVNQAIGNGARAISMSFGSCTASTGYKTLQTALARANARGVSTFVASGDQGAKCNKKIRVSYPASDPSVVAVGGTSLVLADDNSIAYETGWRLSGGGKGSPLLRPVWQVAASLAKGKYRYVPDVSFIGDERTGVQVYWRGHEIQAGGTSLGAPAWAAIWALVLQNAQNSGKTVASAPQTIYRVANSAAYAQTFHDITEGSNGRYDAGLGWDAVTGWGTPDVAQLAAAVLAGTAT